MKQMQFYDLMMHGISAKKKASHYVVLRALLVKEPSKALFGICLIGKLWSFLQLQLTVQKYKFFDEPP